MVEICITPSGGRHKVNDKYVVKEPQKIEQKWGNFIDISRDILLEDYKKTGIIGGKEVHSETVI